MSDAPLHVVLVGSYDAAFSDWREKLRSHTSSGGVDDRGRNILFVSASRPDRLRGLRIDTWSVHPSAYRERAADECIAILKSRDRRIGAA